MIHLVQENMFQERHHTLLLDTLQKFGIPYQVVKVIPFTTEIVMEPIDTDRVFCWGSVKMSQIASQREWKPGSFWNKNHDFLVYSKHYGENMLNHDSQIIEFGSEFTPPGHLFFARPTEDTKTFAGQVFTKASWDEYVPQMLNNGHTTTLNERTPVQICKLKDIHREIRTWIVAGKVVTASQYRINDRTIYAQCTEPAIIEFAQSMADMYQPADAFVLDVAVTDDGLKIVELNCINCAGFYDADIQKLVSAIDDNFGN